MIGDESSSSGGGDGGYPHRHQADIGRSDVKDDDGSGRAKRRMSSLRQIVEDPSPDGDGDVDFVFTDEFHGQQEFELFSKQLANFGLVDPDLVEQVLEDQQERQRLTRSSFTKNSRASSVHATLAAPSGDDDYSSRPDKAEDDNRIAARDNEKLVAYQNGQRDSYLAVLDEIDKIGHSQASKGLKNINFTFGLMNCLVVAYMFGAHPEHFWIVYALETTFWTSFKFVGMIQAKPLSEVLYYLDFCWVMNVLAIVTVSFLILIGDHMNASFRAGLFMAGYGIYCGPVFLAAMALPFVAFLFHDVNTMANLIIHLVPSMQMYVLRWHAAELYTTWPNIFRSLQLMHQETEYGTSLSSSSSSVSESDAFDRRFPFWKGLGEPSVARNALFVYFAWWIPYTLWMLSVGLKLPVQSKDPTAPPPKYDTVFHSLWRGGPCEFFGLVVWKRPKRLSKDQSARNDFEVKDFLFYMAAHAVACVFVGIFLVGGICHSGKPMHAVMLLIATTICADRGAQRYTYYATAMYGQKLRKAVHKIERRHAMVGEDSVRSSLGTASNATDDPHRPKKE